MDYLTEKFAKLGCDNAPGQESLQKAEVLPMEGDPIPGTPVDFSHGDVDAHKPIPGSLENFVELMRLIYANMNLISKILNMKH